MTNKKYTDGNQNCGLQSRYTEYRDTATNLGSINTGIEVTQYRY